MTYPFSKYAHLAKQFAAALPAELPVDTFLLGGILTTTTLSAVLNWQQYCAHQTNNQEDTVIVNPTPNTKEEVLLLTQALPSPTLPHYIWTIDGASRTGLIRSENQDAYVIHRFSADEAVLVVCDGAGGVKGGREASLSAVDTIISYLTVSHEQDMSVRVHLKRAIVQARKTAKRDNLSGLTTAIVVHIKGTCLSYATLGDGSLCAIWPDGMISQIQTPHHILGQPSNIIAAYIGGDCEVEPRTGTVYLEPDTTIMLQTDGSSDLFSYESFAENRDIYSVPLAAKDDHGLADHFLTQIEAARDPDTDAYLHHDNMTLVIAHLSKTESDTSEIPPESTENNNA